MALFFFLLGLIQCLVLWNLGRVGRQLAIRGRVDKQRSQVKPAGGWPACALIVPVAGNLPATAAALRSLAEQNYPDFRIYFVTATFEDSATPVIESLARAYENITHVVADLATGSGQKNHNSLAGVAASGLEAPVLVFCDSTHLADSDFLRCLIAPLARGEAAFTTGYHEVEPGDNRLVTLGYALSVMFMRFMQATPGLTQPWGGAMAMTRQAFVHYDVARLWASNVVDDCSLAALLAGEHVHVRLCPGAILKTAAHAHSLSVWRAWLDRQILFLKFCMPGQWLALGLVCCLMLAPPVWCLVACADGLMNIGAPAEPFLALCWFCVFGWTIGAWRQFLNASVPLARWLASFFCASFMFALAYLATFGKHSILWGGICYQVGKGGRVSGMSRH